MQAWHWHLAIIEEREEKMRMVQEWLSSRGARRIANIHDMLSMIQFCL